MTPPPTAAIERIVREHLDYLAVADPEAAQRLGTHLAVADPNTYWNRIPRLVEEVVEALAVEITYGRRLAEGFGCILAEGDPIVLAKYRDLVKAAAVSGPTLAGLFAQHLVPLLIHGDQDLVSRFEATTRVMLQKGTYTLKAPLETLSDLVRTKDMDCARAFLNLLAATYAENISYNRAVYLTHTLPRAVNSLQPRRRLWQIKGLTRVIQTDERLADHYIQGCATGLELLSETALSTFLDQAIQRHRQDPKLGARYLSLESHLAREACRDLQVAVPLAAVQPALARYARARTGLPLSVRPMSALSAAPVNAEGKVPLVYCDGRCIYLPDEMDLMAHRKGNSDLYKLLVRIEAGAIEFGTYDLDAEKALKISDDNRAGTIDKRRSAQSELAWFLYAFTHPKVALDLFTLFEHLRIAREVSRRYPGLYRRMSSALDDRHLQTLSGFRTGGTLFPFYQHLVMGSPLVIESALEDAATTLCSLQERLDVTATATTSATLAATCYPTLVALIDGGEITTWLPLSVPFGRCLDPTLFSHSNTAHDRLATDIHARLKRHGIHVYRSDLKDLLDRQDGRLTTNDIRSVIINASSSSETVELSWLDLQSLASSHGLGQPIHESDGAHAFRYREWDKNVGDYLPNRVRILERSSRGSDDGFYRQTIDGYHGLVNRIRYAFELLRPEEITILRQWRDGDAFDYRALLDYAMDKRAGLVPSDRLFIKRIKRIRDVAALLLVDLSRSTANAVDRTGTCVLDIEKQAIVLLCEALKVVGDRFAIAGFSGTGPLGVDYYRIKDLDEAFTEAVKGRISAMAPLRSTRMGAAIRHATARLAPVSARVRLILVLGDGYPNDLEYKGEYAVEDTRRAVMEARAEAVHVKAITINAGDNGQLDRLYGKPHHTLIGNIRDLPDKLVAVYSALTRH